MEDKNKSKKKKKSKDKAAKPGRGIESMYRISMNSHVQFNKIADYKSNILISVNAIMVSILLGTLLPEFLSGNYLSLKLPFGILLGTCLITIAFAIVSTLPRNTKKYTSLSNEESKIGEFLFFGNFHKMSMKEYVEGMRIFQKNDEHAYDALSQNFYILGQMLAKKYMYLYIGYRVFLFGFIISVAAFIFVLMNNS